MDLHPPLVGCYSASAVGSGVCREAGDGACVGYAEEEHTVDGERRRMQGSRARDDAKRATAAATCTEDKSTQTTGRCNTCGVRIGDGEYCAKCSLTTDRLVDGVCTATDAESACTPKDSADGTCKSCAANYFLHKGGCYQIRKSPSSLICADTKASGTTGTCKACVEGYFTVSSATATQDSCVACGDENCATCTEGTTPQKCSKCKTTGDKTYLKGSAGAGTCVTEAECTANNDHYIDNTDSGPNGKTCKPCSAKVENCASCSSEGACQKCASGYILDGSSCVKSDCSTENCKACTNPKTASEACTTCVSRGSFLMPE